MKNTTIITRRRLKLIYVMFILGWTHIAFSQPEISWKKALGGSANDIARSVFQTSDGGYIVAGATLSADGDVTLNNGEYDVWIVKLNNAGNIEWEKSYGGSGSEEAYAIEQTSDNGYIITGMSDSDGFFGSNIGNDDILIIKTDSNGNVEWGTKYGTTSGERGHDIKQTSDGGYIVTGFIGNGGTWIAKLDISGNIVGDWTTSFGNAQAYSVDETSDGGFIVTGHQTFTIEGGSSNTDVRVIKLSAISEVEWDYNFGGSLADYGRSIKQTSDGGYIVGGTTQSNDGDITNHHGNQDFWVFKLDALGNLLWQNTYGGTQNDFGSEIQLTFDGGYIMTGQTKSNDGDVSGNNRIYYNDYWTIKLDASGTLLWQICLGGTNSDFGVDIQQTTDSGYIIAGRSNSSNRDVSNNHGLYDFWVVKLEPETLGLKTNIDINATHIYPNPATDKVMIQTNEIIESIAIYTVLGKFISTTTSTEIDISNYKSGIYFLKIKTEKGNIIKKVLKN